MLCILFSEHLVFQERQQLILNAIEQIASAPFLMDLKMAVDWEEMFQPILGELDIFLPPGSIMQ